MFCLSLPAYIRHGGHRGSHRLRRCAMNNPLDIKAPAPLLELRNVQRSYLQGTVKLDVLNNASLSVRAGEMKALVGPSGSGKSTLLNVAGLLEHPDAGEVLIDGVDAGKERQAECHQHHHQYFLRIDLGWQVRQEIDFSSKQFGS